MKLPYTTTAVLLPLLFITFTLKAQQNNELLNLLIKKNIINKQEADSLKRELAANDQEKDNKRGISIGKNLHISGLIQARYQGYEQATTNNSFDLHRARLDVKGNLNSSWEYEIYTEFAGTAKLLEAYTSYKFGDYLKLTAGQFKVPFSQESLVSDSQLEFINRSQVVEALAGRSKDVIGNQNGRDIGIQINGSFIKLKDHYLFDYTLGIFNGAGYNVTVDNNNHKDISGRFSIHPVSNLSVSADFYNGQGFYGNPAKNQVRNRGGIDARYVQGRLSLTAEYEKGTDGAIKKNGWYVQGAYFVIPKKLQAVAKYDTFDPNQAIATDGTNWYTGGLNYFFNEWARVTINYNYRREQVTQIKNNLVSAQFQLLF